MSGVSVDGYDDAGHRLPPGGDLEVLTGVALATLQGEGVEEGHVDLILVDEAAMTELNVRHMGGTGPTDVLSFPLDEAVADRDPDDATPELHRLPVHLGDIVLCPTVASGQAADHMGSETGELHLLVIHAALHLLGHDHAEPEETRVMVSRERHHLARYGYTHPQDQATTAGQR